MDLKPQNLLLNIPVNIIDLPLFQPLALSSFCSTWQKWVREAVITVFPHPKGRWSEIKCYIKMKIAWRSQTVSVGGRKFVRIYHHASGSDIISLGHRRAGRVEGIAFSLCRSLLYLFLCLSFSLLVFFIPFSHLGFHLLGPNFLGRLFFFFLRFIIHLWSEPVSYFLDHSVSSLSS